MLRRRHVIIVVIAAVGVIALGAWAAGHEGRVHSKPTPHTQANSGQIMGPPAPTGPTVAFPLGTNQTLPGERAEQGSPWNPGPPPPDVQVRLDGHGTFVPDQSAFASKAQQIGATVLLGGWSTNFYHALPSQADNIALVAKRLHGKVVQPGQIISYNDTLGPFTKENGYGLGRMFVGTRIVPSVGGGVCQGASTLYNAVVLSNLQVVERHPHTLTVPYLAPGRDATVTDQGGLDFRFKNNTAHPIILWAQARNLWLTIRVYGHQAPPKVSWHDQVLDREPFPTLVQHDANLAAGETKVLAPGQEGVRVHTWLTVTDARGTKRIDLGIDNYQPSPRIVAVGTKTP